MSFRDLISKRTQAIGQTGQELRIAGFGLYARVSDSLTMTADVPVSVLEDGTFVKDHIINQPINLVIQGEVSDVFERRRPLPPPTLTRASRLIQRISPFTPARTQSQFQRIIGIGQQIDRTVQLLDKAESIGEQAYELIKGGRTSKGIRQEFQEYIEAIYLGKQLIDIEMRYKRYERMVITSVVFETDNQTDATSFTINAQEVRFAQTKFIDNDVFKIPSAEASAQTESETDKGPQTPAGPRSFLRALIRGFRA